MLQKYDIGDHSNSVMKILIPFDFFKIIIISLELKSCLVERSINPVCGAMDQGRKG